MPNLKLRWIFGAAVVLLSLTLANPALAAPKLCGCWCKFVFPTTACTEVTPLGNVVTTCSDWLSSHWDQCREPGPFFAPAELDPSLPEALSGDLSTDLCPEQPATDANGADDASTANDEPATSLANLR